MLCTPLLSLLELQCQCREMSVHMFLYRKLQPPLMLEAWIILFFQNKQQAEELRAPHTKTRETRHANEKCGQYKVHNCARIAHAAVDCHEYFRDDVRP